MRRPRSAKARNRGPGRSSVLPLRDLWGFEACERQFSRGRNYERAALWRVARSRGAYAAGIGIRFGVAAAIVRRWRGIIERAPSRLANGQPQEWQERMALRRVDNAISIMRYRSGSRGARRLAGTSARSPLRTFSMMSMRPPQHGHGRESVGGSAASADLGSSGIASGFGRFSNARALATLSARLPLARSP